MKTKTIFALATAIALVVPATAQSWESQEKMNEKSQTISSHLTTWSPMPRMAVEEFISKYGQPDEVTDSYVAWHNNGPWKYTKVWNRASKYDETRYSENPYEYAMDRSGFIEQGVYYRMPNDKIDGITKFDSRLKYDRNDRTLSVRSNDEQMNFLTLNLAHEVAMGQKSSDDAKMAQSKVCMAYTDKAMTEDHSEWTTGFVFDDKYITFEPVIKLWPDWNQDY